MSVWRDLAIGLSLANICYLRVWSEILTYERSETYWMKLPPQPVEFAAVIFNVLFVGGLLGLGVTLSRQWWGERAMRWVRWIFVFFLLIPLNAIRAVLANRWEFLRSYLFELVGRSGVLLILVLLFLIGTVILIRWHRVLFRVIPAVAYILFPFVLITFAQGIWAAKNYNPTAFLDKPLAPLLKEKPAARVVWIIFDEFDQRLAFVDRPGIELPELDRLRREALYASNAYSPGDRTPTSIPSYSIGRMAFQAVPHRPDEINLQFRDTPGWFSWSAQANIFGKARAAGFNSGVAGWYHPYCRVIQASLAECAWWPMARQYNSMGEGFWAIVRNQTRSLFETTLWSLFGQSLATRQHVQAYHGLLNRAKQLAIEPGIGLSFVHLPVPHAPHAYDRQTGQFTLKNSPFKGYVDSLVLMDRTLGEVRRTMEAAGWWDKTTVVVSSDHHNREDRFVDGKEDSRIPFLLKLAGQKEGVTYSQPFNTVLTSELVLAVLEGEVSSQPAVVSWIDAHRSASELQP